MIQKFLVEKPDKASPIYPGHVALLAPDGSTLLGKLDELGDKATAAQVANAYNALVKALKDIGLAE